MPREITALTIGAPLGSYEITALRGKGGTHNREMRVWFRYARGHNTMHVSSKAAAAPPKMDVHRLAGKRTLRTNCVRKLAMMKRTIATYKLAPATITRRKTSSK